MPVVCLDPDQKRQELEQDVRPFVVLLKSIDQQCTAQKPAEQKGKMLFRFKCEILLRAHRHAHTSFDLQAMFNICIHTILLC